MNNKNINVAIAEKIATFGSSRVVDMVVEQLVSSEVKKRAEALATIIKLYDDTHRELDKVKVDQVSFDENGAKVSETFSRQAFENRKRLIEKLAKIDKIVVAATEKDNWGDLYNFVKSGGNPPADAAKTNDSATNN